VKRRLTGISSPLGGITFESVSEEVKHPILVGPRLPGAPDLPDRWDPYTLDDGQRKEARIATVHLANRGTIRHRIVFDSASGIPGVAEMVSTYAELDPGQDGNLHIALRPANPLPDDRATVTLHLRGTTGLRHEVEWSGAVVLEPYCFRMPPSAQG
jgi:hypothetical protein